MVSRLWLTNSRRVLVWLDGGIAETGFPIFTDRERNLEDEISYFTFVIDACFCQ